MIEMCLSVYVFRASRSKHTCGYHLPADKQFVQCSGLFTMWKCIPAYNTCKTYTCGGRRCNFRLEAVLVGRATAISGRTSQRWKQMREQTAEKFITDSLSSTQYDKTSQELGNCPMGQREALFKERLYWKKRLHWNEGFIEKHYDIWSKLWYLV